MSRARKLKASHALLYRHQEHAHGGGAKASLMSVAASCHPEGKTLVRVGVGVRFRVGVGSHLL